jgi:hypothetical protein
MTEFDIQFDAVLRRVLKIHDPIVPPSPASMAALEADILSRLEPMPEGRGAGGILPAWMVDQAWQARVAILAVMLVFISGFFAGRMSYERTRETSLAALPTVLALADDSSAQPFSAAFWGDDDDQ